MSLDFNEINIKEMFYVYDDKGTGLRDMKNDLTIWEYQSPSLFNRLKEIKKEIEVNEFIEYLVQKYNKANNPKGEKKND